MAITSGEGLGSGKKARSSADRSTKHIRKFSDVRSRHARILGFDARAIIDTNLCLEAGIPQNTISRFGG